MAEVLHFPATSSSALQVPLEVHRPPWPGDAPAREAALNPQRSFIVEAPAGSGKTGLLMQRFLNLLGDPATSSPEEILAITFTRKATAELRERILHQLEAAASDTPLPDPDSPFDQETRALAQAVLRRDRQHNWGLLHDPRRLRVQTIDSLCMEIAGTLPLLSNSAARTPVDDATELYHQAARNTLLQLGNLTGEARQLHAALETVLHHRDGDLGNVETLLVDMLQTREQWAELVPLDRASLTDEVLDQQVRLRLERTLEQIVCAGLTRALKLLPAQALAELAALAHDYAGEPGYRDGPNPFNLCGAHPGPPAAEAAHLDHWHALLSLLFTGSKCDWRKSFSHNHIGIKLSKSDKDRLQRIVAEIQCEPLREALEAVGCLPPARYPDNQWHQAKALFRLLLHALAELRLLFAETGQCDFTEFSLAARHALARQPDDFAASSGVPLRHLLVDEMQDTSSAQYDLLTALTRSWDGSSQTLFLVGDPKQSIYLFRQARVERFLRTTRDRRLGDIPLHFLQLTANFRSRPAVVESVNRDFASLFVPPGQPLAADTVDVPFVEAAPTRSPQATTGVHWHTHILHPLPARVSSSGSSSGPQPAVAAHHGKGAFAPGLSLAAAAAPESDPAAPESDPAHQDAATIRRIVERWRATPLPPGRQATAAGPAKPWRIAVLAGARRHLAPIVAEFNRAGASAPIPYRAVKVEPLADRPEVLDAFALTRALYHPADRAAWFAVLRAPWCGLGAADLLTLAAESDPGQAKSTGPQLLAANAHLLSPAGRTLLQRAWPTLQAALELSARNSLTELTQRTWLSLGGHAPLDAPARTNVERYFTLLREAEAQGTIHLQKLKQRLRDLYAEPAEGPDAVDLMTIHGAKGLEWDVVLVPAMERPEQRESSRLLNWLELEPGSEPAVLLAPIHGKGDDPTPLYRWLSRIHTRRVEAQRKRVFYVACTRAREELHLFATATQGKDTLFAPAGSLLHACWPAAAPHFAQAAVEAATLVAPPEAPSRSVLSEWPADHAEDAYNGLALAAAASDEAELAPAANANPFQPRLTRLPLSFDPQQPFRDAANRRLPYTPAAELPQQQLLARPEGSVAVRALGNVVHRFLEHIAAQLAAATPLAVVRSELPTWIPRLTASFRGEGLAPTEASREATRALTLLTNTLADPVGQWLLSPHPGAASERPLATPAGLLRVDRTFAAAHSPLSPGADTLWVVDFKTTEPGGRSPEDFATQQRAAYGPQLARYAAALRANVNPETPIELGLYFPAVPRLLHWPG